MKKMVAMVAFATALMIGGSAMAAPVDIFVTQLETSPGSGVGTNQWTISVSASVDNGAIGLFVTGFSGMTLSPLPQISALDSPFVGDSLGATLQVTSLAGQNLVGLGLAPIIVATLNGGPTLCGDGEGPAPRCGVNSGDDAFGYTALNQALTESVEYSLTVATQN